MKMLSYLDPTKPIKWMLGYNGGSIDAWKLKRVVVCWHCCPDELPVSPGRDRGYEWLDWRKEKRVDFAKAVAAIAGSPYERVMIATTSAALLEELAKKGCDIAAVLCAESASRVATQPPRVQTAQHEVLKKSRLENAVRKHLGMYEENMMGIEVLSDDGDGSNGGEEMAVFCPFEPHAKVLASKQESLCCLLAVAENLLYRSVDEKYTKVLAGTPRFDQTLGRFPAAINILLAMGFELRPATDAEPKQFVYDMTNGVNADCLQSAIRVLNRHIRTHEGNVY